MNRYLVVLFMAFWASSACTSEHSSLGGKEASRVSIELLKIAEFRVDNLTRVHILDFNPEEGRYLAFSEVENTILEIDLEGNIIKRVSRHGQGPGNYGNWVPIALSFGPDGKRVVQSPFELFEYNADYEVLRSNRIYSSLPVRTNSPLGRTPYLLQGDSLRYLVGPQLYLSAHYMILTTQGRDTLKHFISLDPLTGNQSSIIPYDRSTYYPDDEQLYQFLMTKSFFVENNTLIMLGALEQEIQAYAPGNDWNRKNAYPLNYADFKTYRPLPLGSDIGTPGMPFLQHMAGRNMNLINAGDGLWLVHYYEGLSENEYEARKAGKENYSVQDAKDKQKLLLLQNGKQLDVQLKPPNGRILFGLGDGRILVQDPANEEEEEEFTTFSIYEIRVGS
jgi:hypothetical protein